MREAFVWIGDLEFSRVIRESIYYYPITQAFHLVFIGLFVSALLVVDWRLLGLGLKERSSADVARDAQPWLVWGFVGIVVTGLVQFISQPLRYYDSNIWWYKMAILVAAFVLTFIVRRRFLVTGDERQATPLIAKLVGVLSLILWFSVAIGGRLIGLA